MITTIKNFILEKNNLITEKTDAEVSAIDKKFDKLNDLIPSSGMAPTVEGEMVRAISRVIYRYYNDGDLYYRGYGIETAKPSVDYLKNATPISKQLKPLLIKAQKDTKTIRTKYGVNVVGSYTDKDNYADCIYSCAELIYDYVKGKKGEYTDNTVDSRDYKN